VYRPPLSLANEGAAPVDPGTGHIVVGIESDRVSVETYGASGAPTFLPFNLVVAC
jgi:hypothetical protein